MALRIATLVKQIPAFEEMRLDADGRLDRRDASLIPTLSAALYRSSGQLALETLWALNLCGGLTEAEALKALDHSDPFVRLWTVRLLGDQ